MEIFDDVGGAVAVLVSGADGFKVAVTAVMGFFIVVAVVGLFVVLRPGQRNRPKPMGKGPAR